MKLYINQTRVLIFFILILCIHGAKGQDSIALRILLHDENYCDLSPIINKFRYTNKQMISNYTMNRLIRKDLSLITLDDEGLPSLGNYATMNIKENNTQVNLHTSLYNPFGKRGDSVPIKSILSINVVAGINEGISVLFTNKSLNNKAGISGKWSFLSRRTKYVNNSAIDCDLLKLMRERLLIGFQQEQELYLVRVIKLRWDRLNDCDSTVAKANFYRSKIQKLKSDTSSLKNKEDSCNTLRELEKATLEYNKYIIGVRKIQDENKVYQLLDTELVKKFWKAKIKLYLDSMISLESSLIKFDNFNLQWWDIDFGINGEKYNLLNTKVSLDSQLSKKSFNRWSAGFTFNKFSSTGKGWLYKYGLLLKIGYKIGNDNNLGGAELKEVTTTTSTMAGNVERKSIGKLNAYTVSFVRLFSHTVDFQLSKYLNDEKSKAFIFRFNGSLQFDEMKNIFKIDNKPEIGVGVGYYLTLLNAKDRKGTVNFELFFNFADILNSGKADNNFYNRRQVGIKFGVPFKSIFLNE
jgi:hypothetical protein